MGSPQLRVAKVEAQPVAEVVSALEDLLSQARAGKVRSLAVAWETERPYETNSATVWKDASVQMLLGEMRRVELLMTMKLLGDGASYVDVPDGG